MGKWCQLVLIAAGEKEKDMSQRNRLVHISPQTWEPIIMLSFKIVFP